MTYASLSRRCDRGHRDRRCLRPARLVSDRNSTRRQEAEVEGSGHFLPPAAHTPPPGFREHPVKCVLVSVCVVCVCVCDFSDLGSPSSPKLSTAVRAVRTLPALCLSHAPPSLPPPLHSSPVRPARRCQDPIAIAAVYVRGVVQGGDERHQRRARACVRCGAVLITFRRALLSLLPLTLHLTSMTRSQPRSSLCRGRVSISCHIPSPIGCFGLSLPCHSFHLPVPSPPFEPLLVSHANTTAQAHRTHPLLLAPLPWSTQIHQSSLVVSSRSPRTIMGRLKPAAPRLPTGCVLYRSPGAATIQRWRCMIAPVASCSRTRDRTCRAVHVCVCVCVCVFVYIWVCVL